MDAVKPYPANSDALPGLYLLPSPLGAFFPLDFPPRALGIIPECALFFVEKEKPARRFVGQTLRYAGAEQKSADFDFIRYDEDRETLEAALRRGLSAPVGLVSDAGAPGVADPGARVVALAHRLGVPVRPMPGSSSLLLALMASGFNGQQFRFSGYLPRQSDARRAALLKLEQQVRQGETQLFIETPYRNMTILEAAIEHLAPETGFCVACDLLAETEQIFSATISEWRKRAKPDYRKRPAVFLLGRYQ